jgi:hypothetical protein
MNQILKRLIDFIVRRGILVTTAQITCLIVFLVWPDELYWTPVFFCTSKIYVITMCESYQVLPLSKRYLLTLFVCVKLLCEHLY